MNHFDTVREALRYMAHDFIDENTRVDKALEALAALDALEADHFTAHDMASAAAQGYRDGVASMQPQGWKLVPVEPTQHMLDCATNAYKRVRQTLGRIAADRAAYRAMLAASPRRSRHD
jgi:hypothetical protein